MIICLSASFKNATLPMLESIKIQNEDAFARTLCSEGDAKECAVLQTCHRVEVYCVPQAKANDEAEKAVLKLWSADAGVSSDIIAKTVRVYEEKEAIRHLFHVASGLESMIIGEDQILGQVRGSYARAKERQTAGTLFEKVFMKAINTGKKVRLETSIDEGSVSISSAAVDLAEKELGDLSTAKTLIIGAGEAGALAAETLRNRGAASITIANRTYQRGVELAKKISGEAIELNQIAQVLPTVNLVVGAVSVSEPILNERFFPSAFGNDEFAQKRVFIDISHPRAFDQRIGLLPKVTLKTIDDLKEVVSETIRKRQAEAEKSKIIIDQELERFEAELSKMLAQPLITEICRRYEEIRQRELKRAVSKLHESDEKKLKVLERFSRELVERIAQLPIEKLRKAALNSDGELLSVAEQLFQNGS